MMSLPLARIDFLDNFFYGRHEMFLVGTLNQ